MCISLRTYTAGIAQVILLLYLWWATLRSRWEGLSKCSTKSYSILFSRSSASIFSNRVRNWRHESLDARRLLARCIQNSFWLWELYTAVQGLRWGNASQSKMLINLPLSQTKSANNLVRHIGTAMIFCGIQERVWPINNQKHRGYAVVCLSPVIELQALPPTGYTCNRKIFGYGLIFSQFFGT